MPCTCMIRSLLAILIDPSFFKSSKFKVTKKVRFASTLIIVFYFLFRSSYFGWLGLPVAIRSLTPSESGFVSSLDKSFTSKKKLIFEQFLKGIFNVPFDGILIILNPVFWLTISFKHIILGTSPRLVIGKVNGVKSSIWSVKVPLISVDT